MFKTIPWRRRKDQFASFVMKTAMWLANLLVVFIGVGLIVKAAPIFVKEPIGELLFSSDWFPLKGHFGFLPFIVGTIVATVLAMMFSVPICLLSAIYLTEFARKRTRELVRPVIDVLAGIPSVIYGLWGVIVIVPFVRWLGHQFGAATTGYSLLAAAIILSIMVFPIIISVTIEVLLAVPFQARETVLALGATRWETVRKVILRQAHRGILAAVGLGFTRAFGETMAVMMVAGNVAKLPGSLFDPVYTLPALIANNYGEVMSIPMYDSALMLAALFLMAVVTGFSIMAHAALLRLAKGSKK